MNTLSCFPRFFSVLFFVIVSLTLSACGSSGGGNNSNGSSAISAPAALTYSSNPAVYIVNTAIASNTPSSSGGAVTSYSVSPSLPVGLSLSTSTGVISGTPTVVTATASYTVTASNTGGSTTSSVSITVNPVARYTFVANHNDNSVSSYIVDATTGRMKWISKAAAGTNPISVTVDPTGQYAYVLNHTSNDISAYTVGSDGSLTQISCTSTVGSGCNGANFAAGTGPSYVTVDPSGRYAYVANFTSNDVSAYIIGSNGALTQISCTGTGGSGCSSTNSANFATGTNPTSVTVDPTGQYVYVTNNGSNDVSAYAIGSTGALTQINCGGGTGCDTTNAGMSANFAAGMTPQYITVDLSGQYAYVANNNSNDVSAYTIGSTGALTQINCGGGTGCDTTNAGMSANFAAGTTPQYVTVDPTGKHVYVANVSSNDVSAYAVGSNGVLTQINCTTITGGTGCDPMPGYTANFAVGSGPFSVTIDPTGRYIYVTNIGGNDVSQYAINTDGSLKPLSPSTAPAYGAPAALAMTTGVPVQAVPKYAYVANYSSNDVSAYTVGSNGMLTQINCTTVTAGAGCDTTAGYTANFAAGTYANSVTVDPSGKYAYVANTGSGDVSAYTIGSDGSLSQINCTSTVGTGCNGANFAAGTNPWTVTVDPSGKYAYVANTGSGDVSAYTIGSDGSLTQISCTSTVGTGCGAYPGSPANFSAGLSAYSVAIDPSGKYAYVANNGSNDVSAYTIGSNGALTRINCASTVGTGCSTNNANFAAGKSPASVTIDPSGKYVYVANVTSNNVSAYTINSDGSLSQISCSSATGCSGANFAAGSGSFSITVDPLGKYAYVANYSSNDVSAYTIGSDGSLAQINCGGGTGCDTTNSGMGANFAAGTYANYVTVDLSGKYAYVANFSSNDVSAYTIGSNGALTQINCTSTVGTGCNGANFAAGTNPASVTANGTWK